MNKTILSIFSFIALFWVPISASAQKEVRKFINEGNKQYEDSLYLESEITYRKAVNVNPEDSVALYNLGNSLYRQQKFDDAMKQYLNVAKKAIDGGNKAMAADAYHNAGDVCMLAQDYAKAEELFKQSLRYDPSDHETRYNFVLAQKLRKEQEQQQQQNQDQQQQQDQQKQDQQKEEQQQNEQEKQDQQQQQDQNQQQQEDQQQQQSAQPQQMSEEQAEAILEAAQQDEKDVQEKVQEKLMQAVKQKRTDKDW